MSGLQNILTRRHKISVFPVGRYFEMRHCAEYDSSILPISEAFIYSDKDRLITAFNLIPEASGN